jgi:endonuclease G
LLPFGNPSDATAEWLNTGNYLLVKRSFVISYNNGRGTANWAAWRTTADDLAESAPRPPFAPDDQLPIGFSRITPGDYSGSGYDRGHLVPAADRAGDAASYGETFLMTNIVPQTRALNQFPWEKLERYTRAMARRNSDVYVIAGVYGNRGRIKGQIIIPTNCWKIVVVLSRNGAAADVHERTRVIAVDMPNIDGLEHDNWRKYLTTVRFIEAKTGYNFLSALPQGLQNSLESKIDNYRDTPRFLSR